MKKIILALVIIVIIAVGGYFIIKSTRNNSPQGQNPASQSTITIYCSSNNCTAQQISAGAGTLVQGCYRNLTDCTAGLAKSTSSEISIKNFAFDPGTLTVPVGTTVIWTNNDSAPHRPQSATFDSGVMSPGDTFSFTFTKAGTFDYICAIHTYMKGKIIVTQ